MRAIVWLLTGIIFFLSLWIVLPGPNLFFLRLAVGATEISPLLAGLGIITLLTTFRLYSRPPFILAALLLITILFSSLPLLQYPSAFANAEASMAKAFPSLKPQATSLKSFLPTYSLSSFFQGTSQSQVRHQANIAFPSAAGTPLALDLYQPPEPGLYPTVVTIYGGGWAAGSPSANATFSQWLATKGYVVVAIDYRHAPTHRFPAQLEDVQIALKFIRDRAEAYEIDLNRIGLVGWSAGAHLAMLEAFQNTENIRSLINYYGPVDLTQGYADPPMPDPIDVRAVLRAFIGGTPSNQPETYRQASPLAYVKRAEPSTLPPTLLIYGGRDHVVEAKFGKRLFDAIATSNNQAVWVYIPWAEHAFDKVFYGVSNQLALHCVEHFLDQTLRL